MDIHFKKKCSKNITIDNILIKLLFEETNEMRKKHQEKKENSYFAQTGQYKKENKK